MKLVAKEYSPADWRLFIDSSKRSLNCVLHITNVYGSIPIGHPTTLKEKYDAIKSVLLHIKYNDHQWVIYVDLKMVNFLLGQRDSRDKENHWTKKDWPVRDQLNVEGKNVIAEQLVPCDKIVFPPLRIKLGFIKQFLKTLEKDGDCFQFTCKSFPSLSNGKLKTFIFDGPQIWQLTRDQKFLDSMNEVELASWLSFAEVIKNFLGNYRADNYKEVVNNTLRNLRIFGINTSVKVHFLHSHLDWFLENLGDVSNERREWFHIDIKAMEKVGHQGRWDIKMMADYCWNLKCDKPDSEYSRKSWKQKFLPYWRQFFGHSGSTITSYLLFETCTYLM